MERSMVMIIGFGVALSACQDTAGPAGDRLSRAEALQLAAAVVASSEGAATASMTASAGATVDQAGGPPTSFTHTHQSSHPCPSGGTLDIDFVLDGSFDTDTHSLQADLNGAHTHTACAFPHQGVTLTVDGEPSLAFTASLGAVNGLPSQPFTFTLDGGFSWQASDGRSGLCPLTIDASTDFNAKQRTVTGTVCGHSFTQTTTWS